MSAQSSLRDVRRWIATGTFEAAQSSVPRIGVEVEYFCFDASTRAVVPLESRLVPALVPLAERCGWKTERSAKGAPRFLLPGGAAIAFEPGGQLEYASPPAESPAALLADLRIVLPSLETAARESDIALVPAGIDPFNPAASVPLQLGAERYRLMQEYFETIGPAGVRMMRQTASIQISVDSIGDRLATWRVLNALAPYLVAMFANSPRYAGEDSGFANYRSRTWQMLDPTRTGLLALEDDAIHEYVEFALNAPVMLHRTPRGEYLPLREWVTGGDITSDFVTTHLSTLFPEIRPRGHFEVRSVDALPSAWVAAPILFVVGLVQDAETLSAALELLGQPDPVALERAALFGLRDKALAQTALELAELSLSGCTRLGTVIGEGDLDTLCAFFDKYTRRCRAPGDDATPTSVATAA